MYSKRMRATSGFTIAELMVALVLAALFSLIMFNFLTGQARFTAIQDARGEVEQNTRGSLELMMSELRAVPGGAIATATDNVVEFRIPRLWGVLCGPVVGNTVTVVLPSLSAADAMFPADYPGTGPLWGFAVEEAAVNGGATYATTTLSDTATTVAGNALCTANLGAELTAPANELPPKPLTLTVGGVPPYLGTAPGAGAMAFIYQTVRYDVGSSSVAPGLWLRRTISSNPSVAQPVAGPLEDGNADAVKFVYRCRGGILGVNAANHHSITSVEIQIAMQSRPSTQSVLQVERDTVTVHLRNSGNVNPC
jgi:type II secretory pathway pseudopilin PulG